MIKNLLLFIALSLSTLSYANAQKNMPDVNAAMGILQQKMILMPFITASIDINRKLSSKDVKLYIHTRKKNNAAYRQQSKIIESQYEKAARRLKKGVSFNTFTLKAIELSGKKTSLDKNAKLMGYEDALDLSITSSRIKRALISIEMDRHANIIPSVQRAMMKSMISGLMGNVSNADIRAVKPYAKELTHYK
jgi:hypothetical protein